MAATASSPASRAAALLTADATPTWSCGTAASTADVRGATNIESPTPKTSTAAITQLTYVLTGRRRVNSTQPNPATNPAIPIGPGAPTRRARRPRGPAIARL